MKKCELLSPAGNMEMLKYAISYGADAVYLAGTRFGARKYAGNFTDEELIEAVRYAHLYGVRVYVTINTLIYENEIEDFLEYVRFIHRIGVDAVLVQDMGMLKLIHESFPNLELHASTQMHNNSAEMVSLLRNYGVKRVVLDREMTLDEIQNLPNDIEKEVFCHGALCVSYSGQCLFSSMILNRSGNRGECAGLCRLPYKLCIDGKTEGKVKYYLSLKDLCTVSYIDKILDTGVDSLKIEGRMKRPQYVGYMTKIYRRLIDSYYEGKFIPVGEEEMKNIEILFNRGFTTGYMYDTPNSQMANTDSPNHVGIRIGTYKAQKDRVNLYLEDDLKQGDVIRFKEADKGMTVNFLYGKDDNLIKSCKTGESAYVDNFLGIEKNGELRLVSSVSLNNEIDDLPKRKVPIDGEISILKDEKISLRISDGERVIEKEGVVPSEALNRPISKADVEKQIKKTGSTVYEFTNLIVNLDDNIFVNIKDLNELRRCTLEELDFTRTEESSPFVERNFEYDVKRKERKISLDVVVNNEEQLEIAKKYADNIFTSNEELFTKNGDSLVHFKFEERAENPDCNFCMLGDYGSLTYLKRGDIVYTDYMLNVVNSYSVNNLLDLGVNTVCLSSELTLSKLEDMVSKTDVNSLEVLIYGRVELAKMKYDPAPDVEDAILVDRNGCKYPIRRGKKLNYLMSPNPLNRVHEIDKLKKMGIKNYRVDFFLETGIECEKILSNIHKNIF